MTGLNKSHLLEHLIIQTLKHMGERYNIASAQNLVLGTALVESSLRHLVQLNGPARGLWEMEPATFYDNCTWLRNNETLRKSVFSLAVDGFEMVDQLPGNLYFACAMCRVHYFRRNEPLPTHDDLNGMASYWKRYYNTKIGKGSIEDYVRAWTQ